MKVDLLNNERWLELNSQAATQSPWPGSAPLLFNGVPHALNELALHLVRQFPHKKKVHILRHLSPYFETVAVGLSRAGLRVESVSKEQLSSWAEATAATVDRESLFVMYAEDDPFVGELFDVSAIEDKLREQRVFLIGLSHSAHLYQERRMELAPFQIRIHALSPDLTLLYSGDRLKLTGTMAEWVPWPESTAANLTAALKPRRQLKDAVLKFENAKYGGSTPYFTHSRRYYDRAVIYWKDMDGTALVEALTQMRGIPWRQPGWDTHVETASLTRWGGLRTMDWLKTRGLEDEMIRGLVVITSEWMDDKIASDIETCRKKILQLQQP